MHASKEQEMTPTSAGSKSDPHFSGGLQVVDEQNGFNSMALRSIFAGNSTRTSETLADEPKRPMGLQGPPTGPGILGNSIRVSLIYCASSRVFPSSLPHSSFKYRPNPPTPPPRLPRTTLTTSSQSSSSSPSPGSPTVISWRSVSSKRSSLSRLPTESPPLLHR